MFCIYAVPALASLPHCADRDVDGHDDAVTMTPSGFSGDVAAGASESIEAVRQSLIIARQLGGHKLPS